MARNVRKKRRKIGGLMEQLELFDNIRPTRDTLFSDMLNQLSVRYYNPDAFGKRLSRFTHSHNSKPIKTLSLFAGAGGLDIGFEDAGFNIIEQNELVPEFAKTLSINNTNGRNVVCKDVREYDGSALAGKVDFIIGGPPCQPFSAAARRAFGVNGTIDDRGTLFSEYVRILKEIKPKGFLFENVYGIVSANQGQDWQMIIKAFKNAGYTLHYKILDAADYGAPQHRARLIIVGLNDQTKFNFPRPNHGPDSPDKLDYYSAKEALKQVDTPSDKNKLRVTGRYGHLLNDIPYGMNYSYYTSKIGNPMPIFAWRSKFSDFLYKADPDQPVKTIKANGGQYTGPFHWENRHFSINELKALQTFPQDYQLNGAKQIQIKQIGNSVPPQFARFLALSIRDQVFHEPMPFKLNYMAKNYKLHFNSYKRKLSRSYYKKAEDYLKGQNSTSSQIIKNHEHSALLTNNLNFSTDKENSNYDYKVKVSQNKLDIKIKSLDSSKNITKINIKLIEPLGSQKIDTICLQSNSSNAISYTVMWKALDHELIEHHLKGDLVQLNGYYQYDPKMQITGQFPDTFPIDHHLMDLILSNEITAKSFSLDSIAKLIRTDITKLKTQLKDLKQMGYEIRNHNTNSQIPMGKWMIPYAFPTLTNLSVQLYKEL